VQTGREQKADAHLVYAGGDLGRTQLQIYPQRLQHVSRATLTGDGAVAMLGHRLSGACDHESGGGADVESAGAVAAGAASVHQPVRPARAHGHRATSHGAGATDDFADRLTLHPQRGQKGPNLGRCDLALHDLCHGCFRLDLAQVLALHHFSDGLFNCHNITSC
jgi:hypothetical protein